MSTATNAMTRWLPSVTLYCMKHRMCLPSECIWCQNVPTFWSHMTPQICQGWFITHDPKNFVTNRCRATPNTSPDSRLDGVSGEVFGVALHLFVIKYRPLEWWITLGAIWRYMHWEGRCIQNHMHWEGGRHLASYGVMGYPFHYIYFNHVAISSIHS